MRKGTVSSRGWNADASIIANWDVSHYLQTWEYKSTDTFPSYNMHICTLECYIVYYQLIVFNVLFIGLLQLYTLMIIISPLTFLSLMFTWISMIFGLMICIKSTHTHTHRHTPILYPLSFTLP